MCVIASIPAGSTIDEKTLRDMWDTNSDGGGIAYIEDEKVVVYKTMKLKSFLKKFKSVVKSHGGNDILMHMRIKTHGDVCIENNHPFSIKQDNRVCDDMVFAHNGILPTVFQTTVKDTDANGIQLSDTRRFNELFWSNFDIRALDVPGTIEMVEELIGFGNKFVVLNANPAMKRQTYIVNAGRGTYDNGVWYSNQNHCRVSYSNYRSDFASDKKADDKILSEIAQRDPSVEVVSTIEEQAMNAGLYEPHLLNDSEFIEQIDNLLQVSGYQTLEDACEGMYFEFDIDGVPICPDCGNQLDKDDKFARTCHEECVFYDYTMDSESYYANDDAFFDEMERRAIENHYIEKVVGHEVTPDDTGQTKLFD